MKEFVIVSEIIIFIVMGIYLANKVNILEYGLIMIALAASLLSLYLEINEAGIRKECPIESNKTRIENDEDIRQEIMDEYMGKRPRKYTVNPGIYTMPGGF